VRDNYGGPDGDAFGIITAPRDRWTARLATDEGQATLAAPIRTGWHALALTFDGATARLFVDGEPADEAPLTGTIVERPDTPIALGAYSNAGGAYAGGIAFATVYDRALSPGELCANWERWRQEHPLDGSFRFAQASDTHITDTQSVEILNDGVDSINSDPAIAFSLWLGDLTQYSTADEMALVRMALDRLAMPPYVLRGNHDLREDFFEAQFGDLNYTFERRGWKFIMLDTNPGDDTPIDAERMAWLREVLAGTPAGQPLVLCSHHPLAPNAGLRLAGADEILALFDEHDLKAVLGAHHHGNHEETVEGVLFTNTSCLATTRGNFDGTTTRGYRVFYCREGEITTQFVPVRDVRPENVQR
jgi:hypothetical protein